MRMILLSSGLLLLVMVQQGCVSNKKFAALKVNTMPSTNPPATWVAGTKPVNKTWPALPQE
ncbi:hypothetical protein [Paraflavitalea speifideaquila]|uniref:hypothetical protein n=1 Tax=Paraflavitalea speifideaquila TaxID=3076558 RepID=UPI0028E9CC2D|nr:hypothetical protein [Paraflavitalea speifideiaquila]